MALDAKFVGRRYGPFVYQVGLEKIREFAVAISPLPLPYLLAKERPGELRPVYHDEEAGKRSPHGSVIAPPTFCVNFAIAPFLQAVVDPELQVNLGALLHGEQEFEFLEVVRPGDTLTTDGIIADITQKRSLDFLSVRTESRNQKGQPVVRALWTAVIPA